MKIKAAAIQLATKIADSDTNIANCERLSLQALSEGAHWIALPEFSTPVSAGTKKSLLQYNLRTERLRHSCAISP